MTQSKPKTKFTYNDYRTAPEDKRYELLEGELIVVPSPTTYHQRISINLLVRLDSWVTSEKTGEVFCAPYDVVLSDHDVLQPDLLYVSNQRSYIITADNIQGGPDLVVEILSPSTADRDLGYKRTLYARHGVDEYWVVDPDGNTIEVFRLTNGEFVRHGLYVGDQELESPSLTGLNIRLGEVF